jgi:hypothetical protein
MEPTARSLNPQQNPEVDAPFSPFLTLGADVENSSGSVERLTGEHAAFNLQSTSTRPRSHPSSLSTVASTMVGDQDNGTQESICQAEQEITASCYIRNQSMSTASIGHFFGAKQASGTPQVALERCKC